LIKLLLRVKFIVTNNSISREVFRERQKDVVDLGPLFHARILGIASLYNQA